jgi:hypothetical protein
MTADATLSRWQRLVRAGLVDAAMPEATAIAGSWVIGTLLGAAAWLAALFLLFFIGIALEDLVRKPAGAIVTGLVVTAIAVATLHRFRERPFAGQLAFAFSLAGQALVLVGLVIEGNRGEGWRWALFAGFEALLVASAAPTAHRVLATLAGALAALMALTAWSAPALFLPLILAGFTFAQSRTLAAASRPELWHAMAIGLVLALIAAIVHAALIDVLAPRPVAPWLPPRAMRWIAALSLAAVSAWAGSLLVRDTTGSSSSTTSALVAAALAALAIAAYPLPGVAAAVVMLLLAYAAGQTMIVGLALAALVGSLGHYYYRLDTTLLDKAGGLLAIGVLQLVARYVAHRLMPAGEEGEDA